MPTLTPTHVLLVALIGCVALLAWLVMRLVSENRELRAELRAWDAPGRRREPRVFNRPHHE